ncbi:carbohydrate ABC transporter permease [Pseudonocardia cypriaca]|uniref:Carbohydrate ABC transporter membrane protein 1 (CUT1 family) n=1 Tax=Pseudonocardia cypriaca TaxID=882449 RepID=A0A543GID3_9PSEU|nr:sugar ABC transporter permease [Pseudonocardia cypriaca]TQM45816.1 carbohydrate ABC transporter membrane protein 1 (CUT1 family) [Pseudonocardia cypriaca]
MTTTAVPAAGAPASGAPAVARPVGRNRETWVALGFILPSVFGFVVFYLWPSVRGFGLSLTDYQFFSDTSFVGLANYQRLLGDETFWNAMLVTVWYVVLNIGFQTVLAILLAVLLHRLTRSVVIRGLVLAPYLVANVVVALLWFWMLDAQIGIVNQILSWFGIGPISFFGSESWAIPTIAFVNTWRHLGYTALLIFAGLVMIPRTLYEAGRVDGASEWQMFWRITMPLLRPVLALVLVITVVGSFQVFDTVAVTTMGGPADASRVIQYYIFDLAFERLDYGYASAVSVVLLVILSVIAFVQLRLMRANESDLA